jgi:molybdopterin converting factor small subunit
MTDPGRARNGSALMNTEDMEIHLRLFGLGKQAAGRTERTMHLGRGDTVGALMQALCTVEGSYLSARLKEFPFTEDRFLILVNGRSVHILQGLDTRLMDGDRVTIMPKAFGG